ncbi:MAG: hypothetical protein WB760_16395 [Xanthobacteraceae bacterium]
MTGETDEDEINAPARPTKYFRPSEFMRGRRPEQCSDSSEISSPTLDRSLLEYHLETLTNRSDEKPFEHFCRQLAQKEICPNLLPQTGPTGGGDSKVDTETYPVAPEIAERWYEGNPRAAGERWAFAISAKKDWKPKAVSDARKIAATGRGYAKIHFISNQFIRDKERADTEAELTRECGTEVRILDRNWIVERVFTNKHFGLAIDALNISVSAPQKASRTGPLDTERQRQLEELESHIADQSRYIGVEYQLAEDCLNAAILGRELELSRDRVDTLFARAERIAERVDSRQQCLRVAYQHAWTLCYWFDDFEALNKRYDAIERLALASDHADDLERLTNIWTTAITGQRVGAIKSEDAKIEERTERLKAALSRLGAQTARPNNAAHARTLLCTMVFVERPDDPGAVGQGLRDFASVLQDAERLGGYPFDQYATYFEELGNLIGQHPDYDPCFELILPVLERRRSEGAAGLALLQRGMQKVQAKDYYDGIRFLGRAHVRLMKAEHHRDLVFCLIAEAHAYEQVDLLWAAHSCLLAAASLALSAFVSDGLISDQALRSIQQLVWLEIRLGRVPHILNYLRFQSLLAAHRQLEGKALAKYSDETLTQDGVLSMLFLRLSLKQLRSVELLPEKLGQIGLYASAMSLLYALGHIKAMRTEGYVPAEESAEKIDETMRRLSEQPAESSLPETVELFDEANTVLRSNVLGCKWRVTVETDEVGIRIGEALLGFLETFFATSLATDALPYRQSVDIGVFKSNGPATEGAPTLQLILTDDTYLVRVEYTDAYDPSKEMADHALRKFLNDLLPIIITRVLFVPDIQAYFERIAKIEEGYARSLTFSDVYSSASNLIGTDSIFDFSGWLGEKRYLLLRDSVAITSSKDNTAEGHSRRVAPADARREPPDQSRLKHSQRKVLSMIEPALWDSAGWRGVAVLSYLDSPPFLALMFENEEPARRIITNWRKQLGAVDKEHVLRISILTGVDATNPFAYSLHISTNLETALKGFEGEMAITMSRAKKMDSAQQNTMRDFHRLREQHGCYYLAPAAMPTGATAPKLLSEVSILKRDVVTRSAWEIGVNDPDISALQDEDEPHIPDGIENPPIREALEWLRSKRRTG